MFREIFFINGILDHEIRHTAIVAYGYEYFYGGGGGISKMPPVLLKITQ
jgi:hypothetical protein